MLRQDLGPAPIVAGSLLTTGHPRHRVLLVKEADGLTVLAFVILDHQGQSRVISVHRQGPATPPPIIAAQDIEPGFSHGGLAQDRIAEVQDIIGIAGAPARALRKALRHRSRKRQAPTRLQIPHHAFQLRIFRRAYLRAPSGTGTVPGKARAPQVTAEEFFSPPLPSDDHGGCEAASWTKHG